MATVVEKAVRQPGHRIAAGEFWEGFHVDLRGKPALAFKVFVGASDEDGPPFRTLVWNSKIGSDTPIANLAQECLSVAVGESELSLRDYARRERLFVVLTTQCDGEQTGEADVVGQPAEVLSAAELIKDLGKVDFARFDIRTVQGIVGFSYSKPRARSECELTILIERPMPFSDAALSWALQHHAIKTLRSADNIDFSQLRDFLNSD